MSPKRPAYENPLIPNARVRQMYRGILRAHLLGRALPPSQCALTAGREAALVSASLDLASGDLVSDALSGPVIDFLRGTPLHRIGLKNGRVPHPDSAWVGSHRILADSGAAARLPTSTDSAARIWVALGAAAALQSAASLAKKQPASTESPAKDPSVALVYALPGELPANAWKTVLAFVARHDLPIIFVLLPASTAQKSHAYTAKNPDIRTIAHRAHVPAIPVDADDPVALYRVAQESIGHARIGGGPALIQCVSFPAEQAAARSALPPALAHLEQYMLHRGIAAAGWLKSEAAAFTAHVARLRSASK
jgi:TPP-dependent pyruvate/acetoin dehydrogenase alpha subunit